MATKAERLREFLRRLANAEPVRTHDEAYDLLSRTLTGVENEYTDIPVDPEKWKEDGRMYPPQPDSERESDRPGFRLYRSRAHKIYIGEHGTIKIYEVKGRCVINKLGKWR